MPLDTDVPGVIDGTDAIGALRVDHHIADRQVYDELAVSVDAVRNAVTVEVGEALVDEPVEVVVDTVTDLYRIAVHEAVVADGVALIDAPVAVVVDAIAQLKGRLVDHGVVVVAIDARRKSIAVEVDPGGVGGGALLLRLG
jgi:hypothetical protein